MQHYVQLLQVFEIVSIKCVRIATLTFQGHFTSSVAWPCDWPWAISYRCSIGTDTLSPRYFGILRLKCIWVLTFLGHVTSSVTWSFFPWYVLSCRCSVDTNPLSWAVSENFLSPDHNGPIFLPFWGSGGQGFPKVLIFTAKARPCADSRCLSH